MCDGTCAEEKAYSRVGTGIVGIIAGLAGAQETVLSDYPSEKILANLTMNIEANQPEQPRKRFEVQGHEWGVLSDGFSRAHEKHFTRVLCADCLWMDTEHFGLAQSIAHFLSDEEKARAWVIAGFHTGRTKLVAFFDIVLQAGLDIVEIWERDADGNDRCWQRLREDRGKSRWMVIAILKRRKGESESIQNYIASMMMQKSNRHT